MAVNYPTSLDTAVGTGTAGTALSAGGPGGESHVSCHADMSSVLVSLETNVASAMVKQFTALDNHPPSSNYATFATVNNIGVLQFPHAGATDTTAVFVGAIPNTVILTTGLKVLIHWASGTATTGNVKWSSAVDNLESHALTSDSYGAAVTQTTTTNATAAKPSTTTISLTGIQSLGSDKSFKIKVTRVASDTVNDTMADIASLIAVEVYAY